MTASVSTFADLLASAVTEPGIIAGAYRAFHNYSLGNQLLAWSQCAARHIQPGPIATFIGWKEKGRHVKKGERALTLCRPVTMKRTMTDDIAGDDVQTVTFCVHKASWFVLAQTAGADVPPLPTPAWDRATAFHSLHVTEVPFDALDGNVMGFARGRLIAVSPLNPLPHKTTVHELAHVLLGHTVEGDQHDGELTPRNLRECEAEAVALLCCAALDLPGVEYSRGYIQNWWGLGNPIPERAAQRILKAANQILRAGTTAANAEVVR
jgi:antirestriction protein ArdC